MIPRTQKEMSHGQELSRLFVLATSLGLMSEPQANALADKLASGATTEAALIAEWAPRCEAARVAAEASQLAGTAAAETGPPAVPSPVGTLSPAAAASSTPPQPPDVSMAEAAAMAPAEEASAEAAATAAMLEAARAAAANPFNPIEEPLDVDEEETYRLASEFTVGFIHFCRSNPGAAGASAAAVQLIQAVAVVAESLLEDDGESDASYSDDGYGSYDDGDWRP